MKKEELEGLLIIKNNEITGLKVSVRYWKKKVKELQKPNS